MKSRWNDAEAGKLEGLDLLVHVSRLVGAEPSLVVWGGGNTSIKTVEHDHRGREIPVLRVKGSGSDLKSVQRKDFPGVKLDDILALLPRDDMGDQEMVSYLAHGLMDPAGSRPSIETLLHGFVTAHAETAIAEKKRGRQVFGPPRVAPLDDKRRRETAIALAPRLRGRLGRQRRVVLTFDDDAKVVEFASSTEAPRVSQVGPATPDHTIYTKRLPCFVTADRADDLEHLAAAVDQSVDRFVTDYTAYFEAHKFAGAELLDPFPRVVLVPGVGLFAAGRDRRTCGIVTDIYHHTIDVIGGASAFGRYVSLAAKDAFDVEYWPLELYKLTLAPPEKELTRRIAPVTGGASGIGRAVAKRLAAEGAHVVIADLDEAGARKTADEIVSSVGAGRALGLRMDVTSEGSVRAAFEATVLTYGGLDVLVSNAGIAHSAPVARMDLADWQTSF